MKKVILPSRLCGRVCPPASKSIAHRVLISEFLSGLPCEILGNLNVWDIEVTKKCLENLSEPYPEIDVCESGSTLRFLLPIICAIGKTVLIKSSERLANRPIDGLLNVLRRGGVTISSDSLPLKVEGKLSSGTYKICGNISSQYISGLMLALPILDGDSQIEIEGDVVSIDYLNITRKVLSDFGIKTIKNDKGYKILGNQKYKSPSSFEVEGDWSGACFFLVAGALCGDVTVSGIKQDSCQGDKIIVDLLKRAGADVEVFLDSVRVRKSEIVAIDFDAENYPDTVPILCVLLANAKGVSRIRNVERLRLKESDRITETLKMLNAFGVRAEYVSNEVLVYGGKVRGAEFHSPNDHRIAMSSAILACSADGVSTIHGVECVEKSYREFFDHLDGLMK